MPRLDSRGRPSGGGYPPHGGPRAGDIPRPRPARSEEAACLDGVLLEAGMEERRPLPAYLAIALFALVMAALLTPGLTLRL